MSSSCERMNFSACFFSIFYFYVSCFSKSFFLFKETYVLSFYVPWCAASGRPTLNLERRLDHDGHPLAITAADAVTAGGVPPWNWRETPGNGKLN